MKTQQIVGPAGQSAASVLATTPDRIVVDKKLYADRWGFSVRHIDKLLGEGLPHLAVGTRRVRIFVADADAWMKERYQVRRRARARSVASSNNRVLET